VDPFEDWPGDTAEGIAATSALFAD
jgi:hypothetical protein